MVIALVEAGRDDSLPVYLTRFFGRESEVELLAALLVEPSERVITLVGPAGVGKTRLLTETVARASGDLPDPVLFIDGAALDRPELLLPRIVERLRLERTGDQASGELLSEQLAGQTLLLLLDNMEHLLPAAVDIAGLVRALPGLRVVSTSRSPLHISGERILEVEPLRAGSAGMADSALSVAGRLFVDRAAKTGTANVPAPGDIPIIETICSRLDGLPLAIELAAARLRVLSLPALQAVLTNQLAVLVGGPIDVSERHRTLRAAIAWSYDLLDPDEQILLRELGVFAESFALDGIAAVCSLPQERLVDALEMLVDQALLMRTDDDLERQPRFRMLMSIRDFALEQLRKSGDEPAVRARHATWFLQLAERLEPDLMGPRQQRAVDRLARAAPNLRQALDFLIARGDQDGALRLVAALYRYWLIRVQWEEARAAFAEVFAMGEPTQTHIWGAALRGAAIVAETQYDCAAAEIWNRQAIAIWEALGETAWIARSHIDLGNVFNNLGRFDEARAEFARAAELVDPEVDPRTHLVALGSIANTMVRQGALRESERILDEIIPRLHALNDGWILATCLSNCGIAKQRLGKLDEARTLFEESLAIREGLDDEYGIGVTLINLGGVQTDPAIGEGMARRALEVGLRLGVPDMYAAAYVDLGAYALDRGDRSTAVRQYIDALNGYASINDEVSQADVIGLISELAAENEPETAAQLIGAVRAVQQKHRVEPFGPIADRVREIERRLRTRLGPRAFDSATEQGRRFSLAEARVEALQAARTAGAQRPAPRSPANRVSVPANGLTARELDVLRLIVAGKTDRQIADELFISPKTANHHATRILAKLECRNRAAATALALQQGLV